MGYRIECVFFFPRFPGSDEFSNVGPFTVTKSQQLNGWLKVLSTQHISSVTRPHYNNTGSGSTEQAF